MRTAAGATTILAAGPALASAGVGERMAIAGPIPVTAQSGEPFRGENEQPVTGPGLPPPVLIPYGYVEEEYFVSGTVDGRPYKTSLLVRKPKDPARFSGMVAIETVHAQGAVPLWGSHRVWMSGGHGWAAIGSQLTALEEHVRKGNPARYASLTVPDAGEPKGQPMSPAMGGGAQDRISQAIMTQLGVLLKANRPDGPFRGMQVRWLVMGGASQTGGTTLRYIEQSHAAARMPDGRPVYDGYLPMEALAERPVPATDAVIVHPVTEGDLIFTRALGRTIALRPDSDARDDRYRHYQFTADSHVGTRGITDPLTVFSTLKNGVKPGEQLSQFPSAEVMASAVQNFVEWLLLGSVPPRAQPIETANGEIVRDAFGNAKGGVRSPYVDTPTVRYIASAPVAEGDNPFRRLIGLQEPLPPEKLRSLYGTRDAYLARFDKGIDAMVAGRWLLADDAGKLKADEAAGAPRF